MRRGAWLGRSTAFTLDPREDAVFGWRLRLSGAPRGVWLVLTYREHAVDRPLRPLIRLVRDADRHDVFPLPGAALGAASWLGYLPSDCTDIHLALDPRTDFELERVGVRSHADIFAECFAKRPARAFAALYNAVRGDERRFRDILRGACATAPRTRYRQWAASRRRLEAVSPPEAGPVIHLVLPTGRSDADAVVQTLRSLMAQTLSRWHCTVAWADGCETMPYAGPRVSHRDWTGASSLRDLVPHADVLGILTPGECLTPDALALMTDALGAASAPEMVYADGETVADDPRPRLKPDWSPDLALAQGYPGFTLYAGGLLADLMDRPFGPPETCRIDIGLRAAGAVAPERAAHLPRILLQVPAADRAAWPAGRVERYLAETGSAVRWQRFPAGPDLLWPLPEPAPLVSIVIPSRDRLDLIRTAIDGLLNGTAYPALEVVIVDNGSTDPAVHTYYDGLRRDPRVTILDWLGPFDFSAMTNAGVASSRGRVVVLLNNDIAVLRADWLDALVRQACRPEVGAVGAKLLYADGTLQHAGVVVGLGGRAGHILRRRPGDTPGHLGQMRVAHEVSAVTAACLAVERHKYDAVGGLDAEAFPIDFNDVDLCLRLGAAGYKTVWTPHAVVAHLESTSRGPAVGAARVRFEAEAERFVARWRDTIRHDPYYHPALSLTTFGEDLE
ncbi:glycosyltransferase family 2 protein [Methylobacterium gossipiicola]|uniref:Glycosyltransferase, GT2 family n=1 Tax=Methylobacterium gossipiicola TaxID=582675 RepID=A0A1I2VFZ9_9HYPH|nr:glycosyltransferase family 2 protein [Methylobacterium gossipiicola]SFG87369.1 Glycosyltransferase, GT2 family [Methylobacterium gossipiicola]